MNVKNTMCRFGQLRHLGTERKERDFRGWQKYVSEPQADEPGDTYTIYIHPDPHRPIVYVYTDREWEVDSFGPTQQENTYTRLSMQSHIAEYTSATPDKVPAIERRVEEDIAKALAEQLGRAIVIA